MKHHKQVTGKTSQKDKKAINLEVSTNFIAALLGVSPQAVNQWVIKKSCPKLAHGTFDAKAVLDWWLENIHGGNSPEIEDVKLEYWRWKSEAERIKVETLQGRLISEDQIIQEWAFRMSEVTTGMQALSRRLPPMLDGKSKSEQQAIIDNEIWKLRDNYCRTGRFCPPVIE